MRARCLAASAAIAIFGASNSSAQESARFDYFDYRPIGIAEPAAGDFANPVLPGFYPDPSIVAVGDDYYLVNSTFSWFPGLPVFHSRDLVGWTQVGNAIDRPGMIDLSGLGTARGLFAPAIEYHDGLYWIVNTCIDCRGNFVITAKSPEGPWSDPVWLEFGGIDPSLVFGDDGRAWIVYNDAPPGEPLYEGHRAIWLQRFDPVGRKMLAERHLLVNGGVNLAAKPVWAEGPHIYKIGDYFYLMAAEGGTADQHSETIYRSRTVEGPYEPGPRNPILTQRDLPTDRPERVEATGHADMVQLPDGKWWGVFLATRPFAGQSTLLGRETFLLPVEWIDGWPRFLAPGKAVSLTVKRPTLPVSSQTPRAYREEFSVPLGIQWLSLRTPGTVQRWAVDQRAGQLVLAPGDRAASSGSPAFVGRRLTDPAAEITTQVIGDDQGNFAGLLAFMDENHFLACGREDGAIVARLRKAADEPEQGVEVGRVADAGSNDVELRLNIDGGIATCAARARKGVWRQVGGPINVEPLSSIHAELFTGLVVGLYAAPSG